MSETQIICRHWVGSDTKGHICGAEATARFNLCQKHYDAELARASKNLEKDRASQARAEAAWIARNVTNLPQWRITLERAQAELARRTATPTDDTAAYGGNMHKSITRQRNASLSDSNLTRVVELQRIIRNLTHNITRAEA